MAKRLIPVMLAALLLVPVFALYALATEQAVVMDIKGMTCDLCPIAVKKSLKKVKGVKDVKVSFEDKKARLTAEDTVTDKELEEAVKKAGEYTGKVIERKPKN